MFGAYVSNQELMTLYFAIEMLFLTIIILMLVVLVFKVSSVKNIIELNSTSVSGKGNSANGG